MKIKLPYWYLLAAPFAIYYAGVGLNILAVTANQGTMPFIPSIAMYWEAIAAGASLYPGLMADPIHKVMAHSDHLKFLCDWIQLSDGVCSPGDVGIWTGDALKIPGIVAYVLSVWHNSTS